MQQEQFLTTQEIADELGVSVITVSRWLRSGELVGTLLARKIGYRVRRADLDKFLADRNAVQTARRALTLPKIDAHNARLAA